ncbi:MAG: hypothetical protein ACI914_001457 [Candidatus Marivariicella framensis]|jgi:hypothetical protein
MEDQKKQTKIMLAWTLAWVVSLGVLTFAENALWENKTYTTIGLIINFAIGIGMIIANKNLFKTYDELQKRIQFEAMAITLGLAVVVGLTYEVSFDFGIIGKEPEFEYLMMFISLSYIIANIVNYRRFR